MATDIIVTRSVGERVVRVRPGSVCLALVACLALTSSAVGQSVCLPAPRLMTTMPMGGQVGTTFDVTITGQNFEDVEELSFSHPSITAQPKLDDNNIPVPLQFVVTIAADCPAGIHEARVMTRLGVSSSRAFNVGTWQEVQQTPGNTTLDKAMTLSLNSICNATMTKQAVDFYRFEAEKGQRVVVDCAAKGIDSKLNAVLIVADENGNDLKVERRGGVVDFTAPESGSYTVKVHDLTFSGGAYYFYRLALQTAEADEVVARLPKTSSVSSFSWPPVNLAEKASLTESEPNNDRKSAQKISLPCDISGSFYPAADVDTYEFTAKKGDVWWVEVASERLGRPTDPSIVVQHVVTTDGEEKATDIVEMSDIPSPVKVSSNGYSYDGPPYNAGSSDVLAELKIEEDGLYRLQLSDLFGGTRNDPQNVYRLIVRKAAPDFAIVGWGLHMNLRNGDRNALSKPIALRGGATMAIEVVAIRRDGFSDEIDLDMTNLPEGVSATGLKIPAGQTRGIVLVTAADDAPRGLSSARFIGRAKIDGQDVTREARFASMAWPVPNAWSEIPAPRLLADVPISVCGSELAPITLAAKEDKIWEATAGKTLSIPLLHTRRCEFSGANISLKTFGTGFDKNAAFDASLTAEASEVVLDLAKLKTPPGDYVVAFYGSAVAKYQYNPEAVVAAEAGLQLAKKKVEELTTEATNLAAAAKTAPAEQKAEVEKAAEQAMAKKKAAEAAAAAADKTLKAATAKAKPKDIVDIVVSTPVKIRVNPAEESAAK